MCILVELGSSSMRGRSWHMRQRAACAAVSAVLARTSTCCCETSPTGNDRVAVQYSTWQSCWAVVLSCNACSPSHLPHSCSVEHCCRRCEQRPACPGHRCGLRNRQPLHHATPPGAVPEWFFVSGPGKDHCPTMRQAPTLKLSCDNGRKGWGGGGGTHKHASTTPFVSRATSRGVQGERGWISVAYKGGQSGGTVGTKGGGVRFGGGITFWGAVHIGAGFWYISGGFLVHLGGFTLCTVCAAPIVAATHRPY